MSRTFRRTYIKPKFITFRPDNTWVVFEARYRDRMVSLDEHTSAYDLRQECRRFYGDQFKTRYQTVVKLDRVRYRALTQDQVRQACFKGEEENLILNRFKRFRGGYYFD